GRITLDTRNVEVDEIVRGAVEAVLPTAEGRGVGIHVDSLPADVAVTADPRRLEQVFVNLLGNAVKFTPEGGQVRLRAAVAGGAIDIRVQDTGRGIARAFLPQVFERFRQAEAAATRSAGGLGLGLFIARRIVEAHGGSIRAESDGEGRGATFTVSLPVVA